jgi:Flp pilus assembly protein TadG
MLDATRSKFASRFRKLMRGRLARRFVRRQDGAAAVEFALVAVPFLALTFAILETAMVFFGGQMLQSAASESGRKVMTGQAMTTNFDSGAPDPAGFSKTNFHDEVCRHLIGMFDCTKVVVDVQTYGTFAAVNSLPPLAPDGTLDDARANYNRGDVGSIVAVSVYYPWPIYVSQLDLLSSNSLAGSNRLLVATSVFRVEPFH